MKTFTYTKQVGPSHYSESTDEEFCDGIDIEYSVSSNEIRQALTELIFDEFFKKGLKDNPEISKVVYASLKEFITEIDIEDELTDIYEDSLKDYFEEEALNN